MPSTAFTSPCGHVISGWAHRKPLHLACRSAARLQTRRVQQLRTVCMAATVQFVRGVDEPSTPDVKLTRARDGSSGTALFVFSEPSIFEASSELGEITGMYLIDDEGTLQTVDVQAKFLNGKPERIEAKYVMRSAFEWDRFMRWMERYAEENGLGFTKNGSGDACGMPAQGTFLNVSAYCDGSTVSSHAQVVELLDSNLFAPPRGQLKMLCTMP